MEHFLFAAYLILFAWIITRVKFFTHSGLSNSQLVIFFLIKVMAGILYGWIGVYYGQMAQMVDTWGYHYESLRELQNLKTNPSLFFTDIFYTPHENGFTRFLSEDSWWNDLKGNLFVKILAFFQLLSFGNYYINVVFYSFLTLFGPIAIYRVMDNVFRGKEIPVLLSTFLIPSFLYWTSGIHKDGILFVGFALIIYSFYFGLKKEKFSGTKIISIIAGILLVLGLRNFYFIPLIPALLAWWISVRLKRKPIAIYSVVYLIFILFFFTGKYIHPKLDFPAAVAEKQQAFLKLSGGSTVQVNEIEPTFISFFINAPQSFALAAIRPFPSDVRHLLSLAAALEILLLLSLFIAFLFCRNIHTPYDP
ncbi:MAG TPA: hypothetical protein VM368_04770, partial [Flavisolibacter sp.]|nr:hypothetical protein [Flavisolibacter sp.]